MNLLLLVTHTAFLERNDKSKQANKSILAFFFVLTVEGLNAVYIILRKPELGWASGEVVDWVHQRFFFV